MFEWKIVTGFKVVLAVYMIIRNKHANPRLQTEKAQSNNLNLREETTKTRLPWTCLLT